MGHADPADVQLPRGTSNAVNTAYCGAKVGDLVDVPLADMHPTQGALGYDEVYYRLGRYTQGKDTINKRYDDWCEANGQGQALSAPPGRNC